MEAASGCERKYRVRDETRKSALWEEEPDDKLKN